MDARGDRTSKTGCNKSASKCSICLIYFSKTSSLRRHMMSHTGEKPHTCNLCNFACSSTSGLNRHLMNHMQEKPYICNQCGKTFSANSLLEIHKRSVHVEATWKCEVCESCYKTKGDLKKHVIRKHDPNEERMECTKCFIKVLNIIEHTKRAHFTGTPFSCEICTKSYKARKYLKRHLLTHKTKTFTYNCPLCNKSFSDAVDLKSHKESHISISNQNRLACNICEQLYPRRGLLTHMKSHKTGVICNICNAVLANQTNLKGHIAQKHIKKERERCSFEDRKTEFYAEYRL